MEPDRSVRDASRLRRILMFALVGALLVAAAVAGLARRGDPPATTPPSTVGTVGTVGTVATTAPAG